MEIKNTELYCVREWLNDISSSSTGSIVVFDGMAKWDRGDDKQCHTSFIEISDCHGKVRLHRSKFDTVHEFAEKMSKLAKVIGDFSEHLSRCNPEENNDKGDSQSPATNL